MMPDTACHSYPTLVKESTGFSDTTIRTRVSLKLHTIIIEGKLTDSAWHNMRVMKA